MLNLRNLIIASVIGLLSVTSIFLYLNKQQASFQNKPPEHTSTPTTVALEMLRIEAGKPFTISITTEGTAPFVYQWYKDDVLIPNATNQEYTILHTKIADSGTYSARVTNSAGFNLAQGIILDVYRQPLLEKLKQLLLP